MANNFSDVINILGIKLPLYSKEMMFNKIDQSITNKDKITILSGNIHSFNLAYLDSDLRKYMNSVEILRIDGAGLRLGAAILGHKTPQRLTWADLAWDLASFATGKRFKLFLLGNKPGIAEQAAQKLTARFKDLKICGIHHGYYDKNRNCQENSDIIDKINNSEADILIIGMGMPTQEKWLKENRHDLNVPVVMTGGAVFEWIAGVHKRGPRWMLDNGFEWLARLIIEPKRLWKRYLVGNPVFLYRVCLQKIFKLTPNS